MKPINFIVCTKSKLHKERILRFILVIGLLFTLVHFLLALHERGKKEGFNDCLAENRLTCGEEATDSVILSSHEISTHDRSIMLIEGYRNKHLSPRMLCTVESAASAHSNVSVDVFMTARQFKMTEVVRRILDAYENIKLYYLNSNKLYLESPMREWFLKKTWMKSYWPDTNYNDPLRWLLLLKYGGIYLDMDVIVIQNLQEEKNFAGLESQSLVGAGVLRFVKNHPLVKECVQNMAQTFSGTVWGANAPKLLTKALVDRCGMKLPNGKLQNCTDVKIFEPKVFYPIPWKEWQKYFENDQDFSKKLLSDSDVKGLHLWNFLSHDVPVNLRESSPYALAAKRYCPITVSEVGNKF